MGITISHGAWESSYYAFDRWRQHIFRVAGFGDLRTITEYFDPDDEDDWPGGVPDGTVTHDLRDEVPKSNALYPLFDMADSPGFDTDEDERPSRSKGMPALASSLEALMRRYRDEWPDDLRACVEDYVSGASRGRAYIRSAALPPLARALGDLLKEKPEEFDDDYRKATERFIEGCRRAHAIREDLIAQ
jgi:hypothetical protein